MTDAPAKFSRAPFPYFGGKSVIAPEAWKRLGAPAQYIEPFCGSAAMLLAAPAPASLEVVCDANFYIANFWRCIKFQPEQTYIEQDYPVSHVDLDARHRWLTDPARTAALRASLADPEWPGDARIAGWWVWGQCCWIGSGWCERDRGASGNAGRGVQSQVPHASDAGMGVDSQAPITTNLGQATQSVSHSGGGVRDWFRALSSRLERVRINHGDWTRCLNSHYGDSNGGAAYFFDPPYVAFERLYHATGALPVAKAVEEWCRAHADAHRIALCGHRGDYDLPGWEVLEWSRGKLTYGGGKTTAEECVWFSPLCLKVTREVQADLFAGGAR